MAEKAPFPGFTSLSECIFLYEPNQPESVSPDSPEWVLIYGWGNSLPKHLAKYVEGYMQLFPHSRFIVVLTDLYKNIYGTTEDLAKDMMPVVDAVFGVRGGAKETVAKPRILCHAMSNTGMASYLATLEAYRLFGPGSEKGEAMPQNLMVLDSTPSTVDFQPFKWSLALAYVWAPAWNVPVYVAQPMWFSWLLFRHTLCVMGPGKELSYKLSTGPNDPALSAIQCSRLYIYGKRDILIDWTLVEEHMSTAKSRGYDCKAECYETSEHVSHMRTDPKRYWNAVEGAWNDSAKK